ncbi:MAG: hypothetical protein GTO14_09875 [Anaerolineales bacterium]|nr:hypothetical protein [Anaerolineales bacterium]
MERNALFLLGGKESEFLKMISSSVPEDGFVVAVPDRYGMLSRQNILQFFLMPRKIVECGCPDFLKQDPVSSECKSCLMNGEFHIPAIGGFPPRELLPSSKEFIPFNSDWYHGVYVPPSSPGNLSDLYIRMKTPLLIALPFDVLSILLIFILGASIAQTIDPTLQTIDLLAVSVPLGGGALTWFVFMESWLGIPVSLTMFALSLLAIFVIIVLIRKKLYGRFRVVTFPDINLRQSIAGLRNRPHLLALTLVLAFLFLSSLVISVGRGYSFYDGIANWALKGYGIALEKTVFAGQKWGGHSLAYPQNVHLLIALFRVLDGDVLPGSKILFPLFALCLLAGTYSIWRKFGVGVELSLLGVLVVFSIPIFFLHSTIGWANLVFSVYLVLAINFLVVGFKFDQPRKFLIAGFLLAFTIWTRPEGIGYVLPISMIILITVWVSKKARTFGLAWLIPIVAMSISYLMFSFTTMSNVFIGSAISGMIRGFVAGEFHLDDLRVIFSHVLEQFTEINTWGFLYVLIAPLFVLSLARISAWKNSAILLTFISGTVTFSIPILMFFSASYISGILPSLLEVTYNRLQFHSAVLLFSSMFMAATIPTDI